MKHPFKNIRWYVLLLGLAAALIILAVLQYRSTRQLSDATSDQMRATLGASLMDLRRGLENELAQISRDLQPSLEDRRQDDLQQLARGFAEWQRTAAHPALVSNVFMWRFGEEDSEVLQLDMARGEFMPVEWPAQLAGLRAELQAMSGNFTGNPNSLPSGDQPFPRPPRPPHFRPSSWLIDQQVPALVHMNVQAGSPSTPPKPIWVIVSLSQEVLAKQVFPELVQRYFSGSNGLDYRVAVLGDTKGQLPIYSSEPGLLRAEARFVPDAGLNLFGPPSISVMQLAGPKPAGSEARGPVVQFGSLARPPDSGSPGPPPGEHRDPFMLESIRDSPDERDWVAVAQHRKGSLEAAVSAIFYRNLAINFGVLLVLSLTTLLIIVTSARARRLGQLQVDFVAGVSHELRTPLTGIVAAAQNIHDGLVESKDQFTRYGGAILNQAHQLSDLIEQILMFSAVEKGRQRYHLQPTDVAQVVDASLKNTESLIRSAGITVERAVAPELPQVNADFQALSRCLENLITNAVKYGGDERWIGVRAFRASSPQHEKEVCISIEDHGIGIDSRDLKEIFEPFYRSPAVTAAQIHGNGLGLPLAARIAEAMGGRLRVQSAPGKGSSFTVHLPVPDQAAGQRMEEASSVHSGS